MATPALTLAPGDDREDDAHVVVVDEVGVAVGGDEGVLRGFGQVGDSLDAVVGDIDVVGDAGDDVDEEVVGVEEAGGDRVVAAVVEGEGDAADGVRKGELRTGDGGGEGVGRVAVVCDAGRADGVGDGEAVVVDGELLRAWCCRSGPRAAGSPAKSVVLSA